MAEEESIYGPAPYSADGRLSSSSSPPSSSVSSESPRTASTFTVSVLLFNDNQDGDEIVPKVEELEDDDGLDVKFSPGGVGPEIVDESASNDTPSEVVNRRPRGRPRKHPRSPPTPLSKAPKGRSKTGCFTCRRRKKKCDERKPTCLHCEKNNVVCEGYPSRELWQSGKQRALTQTRRVSFDARLKLPSLIQGIETDIDWKFFNHFNVRLSKVLSMFREKKNPFQELLLPMATVHRGLMHSVLSLSGAHLINESVDENGPMEDRVAYHLDLAFKSLMEDKSLQKHFTGDKSVRLKDPTVAQVVVLCLKTICEGNTEGGYQPHLVAASSILSDHVVVNEEFSGFLWEFLIFHDMSRSITSDQPSLLISHQFELPPFVHLKQGGAFIGVCDGLFGYISKIRSLRDRIRQRRTNGDKPDVDFHTILDGRQIDAELNQLECASEPNSPEWLCWQLYRTCVWLYLHRTVNPSVANDQLQTGVDEAIQYLQSIPPDDGVQSVLLTPVFVAGCSAFTESQRPAILEALDVLENYSHLGNIKPTRTIIKEIWRLMDIQDERSWDWEGVMKEMGFDFLVT